MHVVVYCLRLRRLLRHSHLPNAEQLQSLQQLLMPLKPTLFTLSTSYCSCMLLWSLAAGCCFWMVCCWQMLSQHELGPMADAFPLAAAAAGERDWAVDFAIAAANQRAERDAAEKRAQAAQMVEVVEDRAAEVSHATQTSPQCRNMAPSLRKAEQLTPEVHHLSGARFACTMLGPALCTVGCIRLQLCVLQAVKAANAHATRLSAEALRLKMELNEAKAPRRPRQSSKKKQVSVKASKASQ